MVDELRALYVYTVYVLLYLGWRRGERGGERELAVK